LLYRAASRRGDDEAMQQQWLARTDELEKGGE